MLRLCALCSVRCTLVRYFFFPNWTKHTWPRQVWLVQPKLSQSHNCCFSTGNLHFSFRYPGFSHLRIFVRKPFFHHQMLPSDFVKSFHRLYQRLYCSLWLQRSQYEISAFLKHWKSHLFEFQLIPQKWMQISVLICTKFSQRMFERIPLTRSCPRAVHFRRFCRKFL